MHEPCVLFNYYIESNKKSQGFIIQVKYIQVHNQVGYPI